MPWYRSDDVHTFSRYTPARAGPSHDPGWSGMSRLSFPSLVSTQACSSTVTTTSSSTVCSAADRVARRRVRAVLAAEHVDGRAGPGPRGVAGDDVARGDRPPDGRRVGRGRRAVVGHALGDDQVVVRERDPRGAGHGAVGQDGAVGGVEHPDRRRRDAEHGVAAVRLRDAAGDGRRRRAGRPCTGPTPRGSPRRSTAGGSGRSTGRRPGLLARVGVQADERERTVGVLDPADQGPGHHGAGPQRGAELRVGPPQHADRRVGGRHDPRDRREGGQARRLPVVHGDLGGDERDGQRGGDGDEPAAVPAQPRAGGDHMAVVVVALPGVDVVVELDVDVLGGPRGPRAGRRGRPVARGLVRSLDELDLVHPAGHEAHATPASCRRPGEGSEGVGEGGQGRHHLLGAVDAEPRRGVAGAHLDGDVVGTERGRTRARR